MAVRFADVGDVPSATELKQENPMAQKPNITYIHAHDTGRHIQPYGHLAPVQEGESFQRIQRDNE
tara:strand:- start:693 stop:887 length:195 start_codon:yes stop_codon:yes gene_type:complete